MMDWYAVAVYTIGGIGIAFCLGGVLYFLAAFFFMGRGANDKHE